MSRRSTRRSSPVLGRAPRLLRSTRLGFVAPAVFAVVLAAIATAPTAVASPAVNLTVWTPHHRGSVSPFTSYSNSSSAAGCTYSTSVLKPPFLSLSSGRFGLTLTTNATANSSRCQSVSSVDADLFFTPARFTAVANSQAVLRADVRLGLAVHLSARTSGSTGAVSDFQFTIEMDLFDVSTRVADVATVFTTASGSTGWANLTEHRNFSLALLAPLSKGDRYEVVLFIGAVLESEAFGINGAGASWGTMTLGGATNPAILRSITI